MLFVLDRIAHYRATGLSFAQTYEKVAMDLIIALNESRHSAFETALKGIEEFAKYNNLSINPSHLRSIIENRRLVLTQMYNKSQNTGNSPLAFEKKDE